LTYAGTDTYDEYPEKLSTISRGKGYWVLSRAATDVLVNNAQTPENNRADFITLSLNSGWNQVGNPYTLPISWEEVRAGNAAVGPIKKYSGGTYSNGDALAPYEGGFVKAEQATSVKVRFQGIISGGRTSKMGSDLSASQWELPIFINQGDRGNEIAGIGMHEESTEGIDAWDDFNPPAFLSTVEINFESKNANTASLAKSMVGTSHEYVWRFEAVANGTGEAKLIWNNERFGDNGKELILFDETIQRKISMRAQAEYAFSGGRRYFKIYFGEDIESKIIPTQSLMGDPYPNPSLGSVVIPFTIEEGAAKSDVMIEIYNSTGQRVQLLTQKEFDPGFHAIEWGDDQVRRTKGIYYGRWISRTQSGNIVKQVKKIIIQ
jgi:predicted secreted protein